MWTPWPSFPLLCLQRAPLHPSCGCGQASRLRLPTLKQRLLHLQQHFYSMFHSDVEQLERHACHHWHAVLNQKRLNIPEIHVWEQSTDLGWRPTP